MQRLAIAVLVAFTASRSFADPCERAVELELDADGVWMATGSDQSCFGSNAWLHDELAAFVSKRRSGPCSCATISSAA